ncbi:uncharacterized protein LOC115634072 [Scaptodrosophila lebanonensis]|uniref:Uncharacterized protein LOC115634072 n=1 Tax=Drosophila lebanonensis TaxID=7225 RepID=A0A6J2UGB8_DROLE|nr:uncharacterized protein LOC115634072 [Scaptodrosophila lebanonensis]
MWKIGECRAPGLPQKSESEILTASDGNCTGSEEDERPPDLDLIYADLESMRQRLLAIRNTMVRPEPEPCLEIVAYEQAIPFSTKAQRQLMELRRNNCIMKCKIEDMTRHLLNSRQRMKECEARQIHLRKHMEKMSKQLDEFKAFITKAQDNFGICIERFELHKNCFVDIKDFREKVTELMFQMKELLNNKVPKACHKIMRKAIQKESVAMRFFLQALLESVLQYTEYFQRRVSTKTYQSVMSESVSARFPKFVREPPPSLKSQIVNDDEEQEWNTPIRT